MKYIYGNNCIPLLHIAVLFDDLGMCFQSIFSLLLEILKELLPVSDQEVIDCFNHNILHIAFLYKKLNCLNYIMENYPQLQSQPCLVCLRRPYSCTSPIDTLANWALNISN